MFSGISIVCFASSYAVALCLEVTRLFFRVRLRTAIMVGFVLAGLVAHSVYLAREAVGVVQQVQQGNFDGAPLSSWYHGCLLLAWLLGVAYVAFSLWTRPTAIGLIFLPTMLGLVLIAQLFPRQPQLSSEAGYRVWSGVHGVALALGTSGVLIGFLAGILYLAQSKLLKQKKVVAGGGVKLPSLERLQRVSEYSLVVSCCLLMLGLVSGMLLNLGESAVPWSDPVVWTSAVLLFWLLAVLTFNACYRPARQGQKLVYLTFGSAVFLGLVLVILLLQPGSHGRLEEERRSATNQSNRFCLRSLA